MGSSLLLLVVAAQQARERGSLRQLRGDVLRQVEGRGGRLVGARCREGMQVARKPAAHALLRMHCNHATPGSAPRTWKSRPGPRLSSLLMSMRTELWHSMKMKSWGRGAQGGGGSNGDAVQGHGRRCPGLPVAHTTTQQPTARHAWHRAAARPAHVHPAPGAAPGAARSPRSRRARRRWSARGA